MAMGDHLNELYQEVILDHYRNPRNKRRLDDADVDKSQHNPVCGDELEIQLRVRDDRIEGAYFLGQGCSISQASASLMTETLQGKSLEEAQAIATGFRLMMQGREPEDWDLLGDLAALQNVSRFPVRIKCAELAWDVFQAGVTEWRAGQG